MRAILKYGLELGGVGEQDDVVVEVYRSQMELLSDFRDLLVRKPETLFESIAAFPSVFSQHVLVAPLHKLYPDPLQLALAEHSILHSFTFIHPTQPLQGLAFVLSNRYDFSLEHGETHPLILLAHF